jgi:FMN phosphatase YigB (HAD superfamily)
LPTVLFLVEDTLVPEHTPDRWQWAWRPQGPVLPERHTRAALRRSLHAWDRRRWEGLTGAAPPVDAVIHRGFLRETLAEVVGHRLSEAETEAVVDRFLRAPTPPPFPDVAPALAGLKAAGWRVAAIGERPGPGAAETLKRAGLRSSVDAVVGEAPDGPWLPTKEAFRGAARELGLKASELKFVGRLYWSDIRAAQRAGPAAFLVDRPDWWPRVTERRLRALTELPVALGAIPPAPPPAPGPSGGAIG